MGVKSHKKVFHLHALENASCCLRRSNNTQPMCAVVDRRTKRACVPPVLRPRQKRDGAVRISPQRFVWVFLTTSYDTFSLSKPILSLCERQRSGGRMGSCDAFHLLSVPDTACGAPWYPPPPPLYRASRLAARTTTSTRTPTSASTKKCSKTRCVSTCRGEHRNVLRTRTGFDKCPSDRGRSVFSARLSRRRDSALVVVVPTPCTILDLKNQSREEFHLGCDSAPLSPHVTSRPCTRRGLAVQYTAINAVEGAV